MEILLPFIPVILCIFTVALFIVIYNKSKVSLPEEAGENPVYREQAGGRFDNFNWTFPFVRVAVYKSFLAISCWNFRFVIKKGEIKRIEKSGLFSTGLRIVHNRQDIPNKVIIWTRHELKLRIALENNLL